MTTPRTSDSVSRRTGLAGLAAGAIVQQIPGAGSPAVTGTRITVGSPNLPQGTPVAGTPAP